MFSLQKSFGFALKSSQIKIGLTSILNQNFCAQPNKEVRLNYLKNEQEGIAVIELNRESGKNSFNRAMALQLHHFIDVLTTDKNCRAVIIRSLVKGIFCAGADLKERKTLTPIEVHQFVNSLRSLVQKMENLPMPTIAGEFFFVK